MNKRANQAWLGGLIAVLALGMTACTKHEQSDASVETSAPQAQVEAVKVYATVGSREITEHDLQRERERRKLMDMAPISEAQLIDELVERAALVEYARELKLDADPLVAYRMDSLLIHALREQEGSDLALAEVSDAEVKAEYNQRIDEFTTSAAARFAVLFVEVSNKLSTTQRADARQRINDALAEFATSPAKDFGKIAADLSDDQLSRYRGGDIGWISAGMTGHRVPDSVLQAAWDLPLGQPSEAILADNGVWTIMKTANRPAEVKPLATVAARIRSELIAQKQAERRKNYINEAMSAVEICRVTAPGDDG